jgi:hypothetical protein
MAMRANRTEQHQLIKPHPKRRHNELAGKNRRLARQMWGDLKPRLLQNLETYSTEFGFSIVAGDLLYLDKGWYVTHTGLIRLARRRRCVGIDVKPVAEFSDHAASRWAFRATVFRSMKCKGFVGYGDADPSNVSFLVHGAEMRVAETRAVNRALRKAYGIGICSVEEIGSVAETSQFSGESKKLPAQPAHGNCGGRTVRDRLCQIIRQHQLDPALVKAFATDFCGVKTLREAAREQVENFVTQLADRAQKDRDALLCELNSYLGQKESAA